MTHPVLHLWPKSFFGKTAGNTADGTAYYLLLLAHAWMLGGSLPNDDDKLRLMTKLSGHRWRAIRAEVMAFWTLAEDGRWHNERLDAEVRKAERRREKAQQKVDELSEKAPQHFKEHNRQKPSKNNGAAEKPSHVAHGRAHDPLPLHTEQVSALQAERPVLSDAQSSSEPAAALSVGHAAQPAQNTPPTPTNGADPMPDPETNARITAALAALKRDLADKNLAAFERPKLEGAPAPQGATQEERERAEAEARLKQILALRVPLPKIGQRS